MGMTQLTNLAPAASYGDLLTTTNNGQGLTLVLENVQDGLGNNSPMQIATNAININRTGGSFQLDGVAVIATSSNINSVCQDDPILPGTGSVTLPIGTTLQRPALPLPGELRFNTDISQLEYFNGITWINL
jgi:hypothetical protein